jgi:hypothetical protein
MALLDVDTGITELDCAISVANVLLVIVLRSLSCEHAAARVYFYGVSLGSEQPTVEVAFSRGLNLYSADGQD